MYIISILLIFIIIVLLSYINNTNISHPLLYKDISLYSSFDIDTMIMFSSQEEYMKSAHKKG